MAERAFRIAIAGSRLKHQLALETGHLCFVDSLAGPADLLQRFVYGGKAFVGTPAVPE